MQAEFLLARLGNALNPETEYERSSNHRQAVLGAEKCACFHCRVTFKPNEIREWVDEDAAGIG